MSAAFIDSFDGASGQSESDRLFKLGYINAFFLEIGVFADHPCRVKLSRAGSIGVAASNF